MKFNIIVVILFFASNICNAGDEFLIGRWGEIKNKISDNGVDFDFTYKSGFWHVPHRELTNNDFHYIDLFEGIISLHSSNLLGINIGNITSHFIGINGHTPNNQLGTFQGFDNAEADNMWTIMNLYYDINFFNDKLKFKFGLIDLNESCDNKTTAGLFLNPSHGIGPDFSQSGINGPSIYPLTSLAAIIDYELVNDFHFEFGVFDAVRGNQFNNSIQNIDLHENDGFLVVMEAYHLDGISMLESDCSINCEAGCPDCDENDYSKVSLGAWYYTESMNYLFSHLVNYGFYGYYEHDVFIEPNTKTQGLALYSKIGIANDEVNPLSFYYGGGIQYVGLIPGRDDDQFGIGVATGHFSFLEQERVKQFREVYSKFETNIEITYNIRINDFFSAQLDYQWFNQPADLEIQTDLNLFGIRFFIEI